MHTLMHLHLRRAGFTLTALATCTGVWAQPLVGITTQGNTGGLVLPSADVLSVGSVALSYGNYIEPAVGAGRSVHQNATLGVGLLPGLEFYGRLAEYTTPTPGSIFVNGTRDISANIKYQLPQFFVGQPKLAVGVNDLSGGAINFKSAYAVGTQTWGRFGLSLGYAKGDPVGGVAGAPVAFDGAFVGGNFRFADNWAALTEFHKNQRHLGLRWASDPMPWLAHGQVIAQLQRDTQNFNRAGVDAASNSFNLSLVMPFGTNEARNAQLQPSVQLPAVDAPAAAGSLPPSAADQLDRIRSALIELGLERVRVGASVASVVVEFENHRYAQNDADALGLVLGVAAEHAPAGIERIKAVAIENGLRLHETSVGVATWRAFLRNGDASALADDLRWTPGLSDPIEVVTWTDTHAGPAARLRLTLRPELRTTVGTEVGALDYSLSANVQAVWPLWRGGQVLASALAPVGNTPNMDAGGVFDVFQPPSGLKTLAVQQTFQIGPRWLNRLSVGRFEHVARGAELESIWLTPWPQGELQLRAAAYDRIPGHLIYAGRASSLVYRHALGPATFVDVGAHQYTDGSRGPALGWTRWYGDVGVQLFYRQGSGLRFAGFELNFPLTPRQGMQPAVISLAGTGHHAQALRTRLTDASSPGNYITPGAVSPLRFELSLDETHRNAGRLSQAYWRSQSYRMREAFYRYALPTPAAAATDQPAH